MRLAFESVDPTQPKKRACGTRKKGGYYLEVPASIGGRPVEDFVLDPLLPWEQGPFRGVQLVEQGGRQLILDWVGASYYPYPLDLLAEAAALGLSRRIPRTFSWHKLRPGALLVLVHARAIPAPAPASAPAECMGSIHLGPHDPARCGGWLQHVPADVDGYHVVPGSDVRVAVHEPVPTGWQAGMFAAFPVGRVAYVRAGDEQDEAARSVRDTLAANGVKFEEVDQ